MAVYLGSGLTTDFPSNISIRENVRVFSTLSVNGAVTLQGAVTANAAFNSASAISGGAIAGVQYSSNTIDFFSVLTGANSSGLTNKEIRVVFAASGISLIYSSGKSYYIIGQSATSAAQD